MVVGDGSKEFPAGDVRGILSDADITLLRSGYDRARMKASAVAGVAGAFGPAVPYVQTMVDRLFDSAVLPPEQREVGIIALLAARSGGGGLFVAIHLYWGLMEGLPVERLADTLLLTGYYSGISVFNAGLATLIRTLTTLKGLCEGPAPEKAVDCHHVMGALKMTFG